VVYVSGWGFASAVFLCHSFIWYYHAVKQISFQFSIFEKKTFGEPTSRHTEEILGISVIPTVTGGYYPFCA